MREDARQDMNDGPTMTRSLRIVLAEDEALIAMAIQLQLRRVGHEVLALFATAEDVLAQLDRHAPDLVMMDVHLAGAMDGIQAAAQIAARNGPPVILVSAYPRAEVMARAPELPRLAVLEKPFDAADLARLISSMGIGAPG